MKPEEVTHISDLIRGLFDERDRNTATVIKLTVNGKIDSIKKSFDDYIEIDKAWKAEDQKWKEGVEPMKLAYINTNWLWDLFIKVLKFFGMLGAATAAIYFLKGKLD